MKNHIKANSDTITTIASLLAALFVVVAQFALEDSNMTVSEMILLFTVTFNGILTNKVR